MKKNLIAGVALAAATLSASALANVEVPADAHYKGYANAFGYQIYECGDDYQWRFRAPSANLYFDDGTQGSHYGGIDRDRTPGPYWERGDDASGVRGQTLASQSNPDSIPLLLLQVAEHVGEGYFSDVEYIQRRNTSGGVGPSGACDEAGAQYWSEYTADYFCRAT